MDRPCGSRCWPRRTRSTSNRGRTGARPDLSTPWIGTSRRLFESPEKPPEKLSLLRKYYYDTAASANFFQMQTLKTLIGISQVVLGDDHPYGEPLTYVKALKELANDGTLTVPEVNAVLRENMLR